MNRDFLQYYNLELQNLRKMSEEFASANPKIADKLLPDEFSCEDPYVERLLEGFSYLTARVHQKIDSGYPRLSQALFDSLFPDYLMPIPSMGIVKFDPDLKKKIPDRGITLKNGTKLFSVAGEGVKPCQFSTAHDVTLWPIEISDAEYYSDGISDLVSDLFAGFKSCLFLELSTLSDSKFSDLKINCLDIYLRNANHIVNSDTFELMLTACKYIVIQPRDKRRTRKRIVLDNSKFNFIKPIGFDKSEAIFPYNPRTFEGYRLFRKYFSLPQSLMFLRLDNIASELQSMDVDKVNIIFVFDTEKAKLKGNLKKSNFSLFCTPVINLFEKTLSRIHLDNNKSEFHIVGERTEPLDFEVVKTLRVKGFKRADSIGQTFRPLYSSTGFFENKSLNKAYYSINKVKRTLSENEQEKGTRTNYVGTESYISIVDQDNAPYSGKIVDLEIKALCSNRDMPLLIPASSSNSDFLIEPSLNVERIKFIHGPTKPYCEHIFSTQCETIDHISLNYLTLQDRDGIKTGEIIRGLLNLYTINELQRKFLKELKTVSVKSDRIKYKRDGMITFLNGLNIEVLFNDSTGGNDFFMLGMILDRFFEHAAPINSYTKVSIKTKKNGEIVTWPARTGTFQMI